MANKVFISDRLTPLQEFRDILSKYYNSDITAIDFRNGMASATAINYWVYQQTHGLISHLVHSGMCIKIIIVYYRLVYHFFFIS